MDEFPEDEEEFSDFLDPSDLDEPSPFLWTRHRILLILVILFILITFLAYAFSGIIAPTPHLPPPTVDPHSII